MSFQTSALILSWVAIVLLALVVSGLVRQVHALSNGLTRMPEPVGPRPGSRAPGFDRLAPASTVPTVLLFLDRDCRTCTEVLDEAAGHAGREDLAVRALYSGGVPAGLSGGPVDVRGDQAELFERYDAIVRPFAVVIDPAGQVVRSEPIGSRSVLRNLLAQAAGGPGDPGDQTGRSPIPIIEHSSQPGGTP
jgi:hypothetical protein